MMDDAMSPAGQSETHLGTPALEHAQNDGSNPALEHAQNDGSDDGDFFSFEADEATSRDSHTMWDEIAARSNVAHARVALHAWAAGTAAKVRRSMDHIAHTLGIRRRLVPILSTASVVDDARGEYQMDVLVLPDNPDATHLFTPRDVNDAHRSVIRTVSLDSDAFIKARQLNEAAVAASHIAEITDGPHGGGKIVVPKNMEGISDVEAPSTLAIALFFLTVSRMANHETSRQFGMSTQLSLALELHTYMNLAQIGFDMTVHTPFAILHVLDELHILTEVGGGLIVGSTMSTLKNCAATLSRSFGRINIGLMAANIVFDVYEIAAAVSNMQVILYTTQLLVDAAALGLLIYALAFGSAVASSCMAILVGVSIAVTDVVGLLVQDTANAVRLGGYFAQFEHDYDRPSFFEYSAQTDLQLVNMVLTSHNRARARVNTAVMSVIDVRLQDEMKLSFGSQCLYQNSRWHKGGNFVWNYSEHMDKTAPMINVREALGKGDFMVVPHQSNVTTFILPVSATSFIEYGYAPTPALYWKHDEDLDAVRRIQANYPFYFEYWGNDMEGLNKLTLKYQPSTIQVKLGSYRRTLLMSPLPARALHDKLTYEITLYDPRVAHTLKVVEHANYRIQMDENSVSTATPALHGFVLLVEGKPRLDLLRVERRSDDAIRPTTIIHIHGIVITFHGKFGMVDIVGGAFKGSVNLLPRNSNGDRINTPARLMLSFVSKQYLVSHQHIVSEHLIRHHGFVQVDDGKDATQSRTWYDFARKVYITAPPSLVVAHPELRLLDRMSTSGDVVYFAPPRRDPLSRTEENGRIYIVANSTGATIPMVFCCPVAFPVSATMTSANLLYVRLSDGLTIVMEPMANDGGNVRVITAINVSRKLNMTIGAVVSRALFMHLVDSFESGTQYRVGNIVTLLYDDHRERRRVQSWYVAPTREFLDVHHRRDQFRPVHILGWDRATNDPATSTYFLLEPTTKTLYRQKGTRAPMRLFLPDPQVGLVKLAIADITDATSDGVHAFVHRADGTVSQLSADGSLRLSAVDLTTRPVTSTPTPFFTIAWQPLAMPFVTVRGALNEEGEAINVWYVTVLDAVIVGDGLLSGADIVYLGEIGTACYAWDPTTDVIYRHAAFHTRNSQYYQIGVDRTLSFVSGTPANFTTPHRKWTALQFPRGIIPISAHIASGKFLLTTTFHLVFAVDFNSDDALLLTLVGVTDRWVSQQTMRYPDESLEDALRALVFRVDQQVAPQLLVGTGQKTQKLYDVAHSFLVTSSAKKQFLGVQTTPRGNARDAEGSNASAYYFTPRTRMVTQEPKIVPRSRGRPYALPVVAAQHAYMLGDTFVVHPLSSTTPVSPILPGKHLIVVGSRVGVDRGMHLGTFDAIAVTAPNDALHTTLDFAQPDFTKFAPIYDGVCADIQCDPVWDVPTCLVAAGYVFGSTRRPLDRTAMDMRRTTGNSTDIHFFPMQKPCLYPLLFFGSCPTTGKST
eukprot:GEMP01000059.1.p1 GENE.GEMP01000059.1~~GEMP01000059.1.p1  ORF type:complete len:1474 (+),score=371.08 GEMP01000059.1:3129-7550(+)